jgi:hypothetical protein
MDSNSYIFENDLLKESESRTIASWTTSLESLPSRQHLTRSICNAR